MIQLKHIVALALMAFAGVTHGQTTSPPQIQVTMNVSWTLPTTGTDGTALTGENVLTKVQFFARNSAIPDAATMAPTAVLAATATSYTHVATINNGDTMFVRVKVCNKFSCGAFSGQASKNYLVQIPAAPGMPTFTATIVLTGSVAP